MQNPIDKGYFVELNDFSVILGRCSSLHAPFVIEDIREVPLDNKAGLEEAVQAVFPETQGGTANVLASLRPKQRRLHLSSQDEAKNFATLDALPGMFTEPSLAAVSPGEFTAIYTGDGLTISGQGTPWILAAAARESYDQALATLQELKLVPARISPASLSAAGSVASALKLKGDGSTALLFEFGDVATHLLLVTRDGIEAVRLASVSMDKVAEAVQVELGLKFKGSAAKLFFNESYDFSETGPKIAGRIAQELAADISALGHSPAAFACTGLPGKQDWFANSLAGALNLAPLAPDLKAWGSQVGITFAGDVESSLTPAWLGFLHFIGSYQPAAPEQSAWQPDWTRSSPPPAAAPAPAPVAKPTPVVVAPPPKPVAPIPAAKPAAPIPAPKPIAPLPTPAPKPAAPSALPKPAAFTPPAKPAAPIPAAKPAAPIPAPKPAAPAIPPKPAPAAITPPAKPAAPIPAAKPAAPAPTPKPIAPAPKPAAPVAPAKPVPAAAAPLPRKEAPAPAPAKPATPAPSKPTPVPAPDSTQEAKPGFLKSPAGMITIAAVVIVLGAAGYFAYDSHQKAAAIEAAAAAKAESDRRAADEAARAKAAQEQADAALKKAQADAAAKLAEAEAATKAAEQRANMEAAAHLAAARGKINIATNPPGASVTVADLPPRTSPALFEDLKLGRYPVTISLRNYDSVILELEVKEDAITDPGIVKLNHQLGSVEINSDPAGANYDVRPAGSRLFVDPSEKRSGTTPANFNDLPAGDYVVTFSRDGFASHSEDVTVNHGATAHVSWKFTNGNIVITSIPSGATVTSNGRVLGTTPLTLNNLTSGDVSYDLNLVGYDTTTISGKVQGGMTLKLNATMLSVDRLAKLSDLDVRPQVIPSTMEQPALPPGLSSDNGTVEIALTVDRFGNIKDPTVVKNTTKSQEVARYCLEAVTKWKFKPGMIDDKPVNVRVTVPFTIGGQ